MVLNLKCHKTLGLNFFSPQRARRITEEFKFFSLRTSVFSVVEYFSPQRARRITEGFKFFSLRTSVFSVVEYFSPQRARRITEEFKFFFCVPQRSPWLSISHHREQGESRRDFNEFSSFISVSFVVKSVCYCLN